MANWNGKEINDNAIIHMIGYCDSPKFIDAIRGYPEYKEDIKRIAKIIDDTWGCNILEDIKNAGL